MKVLNFGSLNLDYVYQVDHFVQPGETLSALSQAVNPGGKGLNQSIALAKAGAEVYHAGCIGQGGESLLSLLKENGVRTGHIVRVPQLQGNAMIQVNREGQNCILLFGGSNQSITKEQVDETLADFEEGDYLVLQNEVNLLPYIVEKASERGMKIILNPSPYDEKLLDVDLSRLSWLFVNEVEASQLSGSEDPDEAWAQLHEKYPDINLLVTLGKEGSKAFTGTETVFQEAMPVNAVDTTAAGDTYTGYFIAGLIAGLTLKECMARASKASSISVTRHGAAASIPEKEEIDY